MVDLFAGPKKTTRWAAKEIHDFETAEKAFFKENPGEKWSELDFGTGTLLHGLKFKEPSDDLQRGAYRIVGDLRNALDQATYSAAKALGAVSLKKTNFPFGEFEADFTTALAAPRGNYRDIPVKLHPILHSFRPFWTASANSHGNDTLRALAHMANPNKHHVPLEVEVQTGMEFFGGRGGICAIGGGCRDGKALLFGTVPGIPFEIDYKVDPRVAFRDQFRLAGKPVLPVFGELLAIVQGIIGALEAETHRLLRE